MSATQWETEYGKIAETSHRLALSMDPTKHSQISPPSMDPTKHSQRLALPKT